MFCSYAGGISHRNNKPQMWPWISWLHMIPRIGNAALKLLVLHRKLLHWHLPFMLPSPTQAISDVFHMWYEFTISLLLCTMLWCSVHALHMHVIKLQQILYISQEMFINSNIIHVNNLLIFFRTSSVPLWQKYDCPRASGVAVIAKTTGPMVRG